MDHLDGIKDLFETFPVENFWDTANTKEFPPDAFNSRPRLGADWEFYKHLRDTQPNDDPRRLVFYSGDSRDYFKDQGLKILAPTPELIRRANRRGNWNDASYVVLYRTANPERKILFTGDSEDETWEHILANWKNTVSNVDVLIAPHHGRDSGRDYGLLKVVNPRLTLFGNALTEHHAHKPWHNRGLTILTNNQAGYVVLDIDASGINVYAKNETYARNLTKRNGWGTFYSDECDGWYLGTI
jgi:beta-lactamase superfamily II metal-dependent hydrolase